MFSTIMFRETTFKVVKERKSLSPLDHRVPPAILAFVTEDLVLYVNIGPWILMKCRYLTNTRPKRRAKPKVSLEPSMIERCQDESYSRTMVTYNISKRNI